MCTYPLRLNRHRETGLTVPCGICLECREKHRRAWAVRCVHEASLHEENCFGTLTYGPGQVPRHGSLDRSAFPKFIRELRRRIKPKKVRYFQAGEYGDRNGRPHYHFLLFGHDFDRSVALRKEPFPLYRSRELEELWTLGMSSVGDVSMASAAYVAGYVLKKVDQVGRKPRYNCDPETGELVEIEREYATMSRRPGLGAKWIDEFAPEVLRDDSIVLEGRELPVPRYYEAVLEKRAEVEFAELKAWRMYGYLSGDIGATIRERDARAAILEARHALHTREL